jgi:hypothetical protein
VISMNVRLEASRRKAGATYLATSLSQQKLSERKSADRTRPAADISRERIASAGYRRP